MGLNLQKIGIKFLNLKIRKSEFDKTYSMKKFLPFSLLLCLPFLNSCDWAIASDINKTQEETPQIIIPVKFWGNAIQSATVWGKTIPNAQIDVGGIQTKSDNNGDFVFGFDRDAAGTVTISITSPEGHSTSRVFKIEKREYKIAQVNGLPPATVNPPPEALAKIERDSALKQQGFVSQDAEVKGFLEVFRWPLDEVRITSPWGAQRSLNGHLQRPHYGVDLGAALGTPVYAPASGKIVIAQEGMHFEGGMVGIDHGQGLITNYLHMRKIFVTNGQIVKAGDKIGEVGKEGRATGPHLCWRMRWRGRQLDPSFMTKPREELPTNIDNLSLK